MKGDPKKLAALGRLAEASWAMEQARLAGLSAEEQAIRRKLAGLEAGRKARAESLQGGPDAARLAGADPKWEAWVDGRRASLMTELARTLARKEEARLKFGRAHGRKEAIAKLQARLSSERRRERDQF